MPHLVLPDIHHLKMLATEEAGYSVILGNAQSDTAFGLTDIHHLKMLAN